MSLTPSQQLLMNEGLDQKGTDRCGKQTKGKCGDCDHKWDPDVVSLTRCRAECSKKNLADFHRCPRVSATNDVLCWQHIEQRENPGKNFAKLGLKRPRKDLVLPIVPKSEVDVLLADFNRKKDPKLESKVRTSGDLFDPNRNNRNYFVKHVIWAEYDDSYRDQGQTVVHLNVQDEDGDKKLHTLVVPYGNIEYSVHEWLESRIYGHSFAYLTEADRQWRKAKKGELDFTFRTTNTSGGLGVTGSFVNTYVWTRDDIRMFIGVGDPCDAMAPSDCGKCKTTKSAITRALTKTGLCKELCKTTGKTCTRKAMKNSRTCWQHQVPDIVDIAQKDGRFSILVSAVVKAGLVDALRGSGLTVFAPTDDAFKALLKAMDITAAELLANPDLGAILKYHVLGAEVDAKAAIAADGKSVKTLQGGEVAISVVDGSVFVNDSKVIIADIKASNGIIHAINKVLMPDLSK